MQVDRHFPDLRQLDGEAIDGVVFELREHKGFELTKLFEARKPVSPFLKSFPGIMQSANRSLQHLRMHLAQMRELLLRFGQVVLLTVVRREWLQSRNDVFLLQRASVYQTLTRSNPVLEFAQSVVVRASARLKPLQHLGLLVGIWIDSVGVVHCQHSNSLPQAIACGKCLSHPHPWGIDSSRGVHVSRRSPFR